MNCSADECGYDYTEEWPPLFLGVDTDKEGNCYGTTKVRDEPVLCA
jgi:hypothetical protein